MTADALLAALAGHAPAAVPGGLGFGVPVPPGLVPAVRVLHTGLLARVSGRRWFGCSGATGRPAVLDPADLIPAGVTLLTVEGAAKWDRIRSAARLDLPHLFASDRPAGPKPKAAHAAAGPARLFAAGTPAEAPAARARKAARA